MLKKPIALALALVLTFSLIACSKNKDEVAPHDQGLVIALTKTQEGLVPKDATVLSATETTLTLSITGTLEETKEFFQKEMQRLGVEGEETTPTIADTEDNIQAWNFDGTYDGGKSFSIKLLATGDQISVVIAH